MIWIDRQDTFDAAMARVAAESVIGVDTEADSLHSYFDKVCLIQISTSTEDLVIDPLSGIELASFGAVLADARVTKILHGGDYDVRILNRDFGYTVQNLVDTSVCAQLLGYEAFGLAALLERHFNIKANKVHQRADWSMRPLSADMLAYAALDTHCLIELAARLKAELDAVARWEWALEEFSRLESVRYRESDDSEPWRKIKNIGALDRRSLAVVRAIHEWRDGLAREADRPPFKILGNEQIVEIAKAKPQTPEELATTKSVARYHSDRYGRALVRIVRAAMEIPDEELPQKNEPRAWIRDREIESRVDRMKKARDRVARDLKVDASILAPRHVLTAIATTGSLDEAAAMREWQKQVVGPALLEALKK